jgi:uncharacterized protein YdgA (DUF945 family)
LLKKIFILAAALVVLYGASAWFMGYSIEKRIGASLEEMQASAPYLKVVKSEFHRGWFVSQQDLTLQALQGAALPGAAGAAIKSGVLQLKVHSVIRHGPICGLTCLGLAHIDSRISFSGPIQEALGALFGSADPLRLQARLGFFGGGSASAVSPAFKDVVLGDGAHASWDGLDLSSAFSSGYDAYAMQTTIPHALYAAADGTGFDIKDVALDVNSTRALRSLYQGHTTLSVARMQFGGASVGAAPTARSITINDLRIDSQSSPSDGFMTFASKTSTAAVATSPLTLSAIHLDFTFRHLDMESLETLIVAMREANRDLSIVPEQRTAAMLAAIKQPGIALLSHQPQLSIDRISVASASGEALISGLIELHDVVAADFAAGADPKSLLKKLEVNLDLTLADGFLKSLPGGGANMNAQLQPLVAQGLLSHDDGKFHTKIVFHAGQATFNGKPFIPTAQPSP